MEALHNNFTGLVKAGPALEAEVIGQEESNSGTFSAVSMPTSNSTPPWRAKNPLIVNYGHDTSQSPSQIDTDNQVSESGWTAYLCSSYDDSAGSQKMFILEDKTVENARQSVVTDSRRSHSLYDQQHQSPGPSFSMASDASSGPECPLLHNRSFEGQSYSGTQSNCKKNDEASLGRVQASDSRQAKLRRLHSDLHGNCPPTLEDTASSPSHIPQWEKETSHRLEARPSLSPNNMEVFKLNAYEEQSWLE